MLTSLFYFLLSITVFLESGCTGKNDSAPADRPDSLQSEEFVSPRDLDNKAIRSLIGDFEQWTTERDPGKFRDFVTESFNAAAFVDSLWAGVTADRVEFKVRQLRISEDKGRAVINAVFTVGTTVVSGRFLAMEFKPIQKTWKADSYQLFGPGR